MKKALLFCLFALLVINCFVSCDITTLPDSRIRKQIAKSNAYGMIGNAVASGISVQPETRYKLQYLADVSAYYIEKANLKAESVAVAAQGSIEGIAVQPETFPYILENLINTCETIIASKNRYGVGVKDTTVLTDLKFTEITDILTNDKYDYFVNDNLKVAVLVEASGTDFIFYKEDNTTPTEFGNYFIYLK